MPTTLTGDDFAHAFGWSLKKPLTLNFSYYDFFLKFSPILFPVKILVSIQEKNFFQGKK